MDNFEELKKITTLDSIDELKRYYKFMVLGKYPRDYMRDRRYYNHAIHPSYFFSVENQKKFKEEIKKFVLEFEKKYNIRFYQEELTPQLYRAALGEFNKFNDAKKIARAIKSLLSNNISNNRTLIFNVSKEVSVIMIKNIIKTYKNEDFFMSTMEDLLSYDSTIAREVSFIIEELDKKLLEEIANKIWDKSDKDISFVLKYAPKIFEDYKNRVSSEDVLKYFHKMSHNKRESIENVIKLIKLYPFLIKEVDFAKNQYKINSKLYCLNNVSRNFFEDDLVDAYDKYRCVFYTLRLKHDEDYDFMAIKSVNPVFMMTTVRKIFSSNEKFIIDNYKALEGNDVKSICRYLFGRDDRTICRIYKNEIIKNNSTRYYEKICSIQFLLITLKISPQLVYNFIENSYNNRNVKMNFIGCKPEYLDSSIKTFKLMLDIYGEKKFLKMLPIMFEYIKYNDRSFRDIHTMYSEIVKKHPIKLPKNKNVIELHDHISKIYRIMIRENTSVNNNLNQWEIASLDGEKFKDYKIKVVKTDWELIDTGQDLKHCVGSYVNGVRFKDSLIFNLYKDNRLSYCVEISSDWRIRQAKGMSNKSLDVDLRYDLEDYLLNKRPVESKRKLYSILNIGYVVLAGIYYKIFKPIATLPYRLVKRYI